jgi:sugar lactone lactonase YvrE
MANVSRKNTTRFAILIALLASLFATAESPAQFFGGRKKKADEAARVTPGPGGMTTTPSGSIIIALHQYQNTTERVVEILPDARVLSFPNAAISRGTDDAPFKLDAVLGMQCDKKGVVWMLDNGRRSEVTPKLVGWDSAKDELVKIIYLPAPVTIPTSFLNDLALDPEEPFAYITDPAAGPDSALIIVDLQTGLARRVLEGHHSVIPDGTDIVIDGKPIAVTRPDGSMAKPMYGAGPIAVDRKGRWVYFGASAAEMLYRVRSEHLRDHSLARLELESNIEPYAPRPPCDGISMDSKDNIYLSDIRSKAISVIDSEKKFEVYVTDDRFLWPDGLCFGNDGRLYFYASQLHLMRPYNGGRDRLEPPFVIYKVKALAGGSVGR